MKNRLPVQDSQHFMRKMLAFAIYLMNGQKSIRQKTATDFVQDALNAYLTGRRTWNREKYKTFEAFFRGAIRSLMFNERRKAHNEKDVWDTDHGSDFGFEDLAPSLRADNPEQLLLRHERSHQLLNEVRSKLTRSPVLRRFVIALLEGPDDAESLAERLGTTRDHVYEMKRRISEMRADLLPEGS